MIYCKRKAYFKPPDNLFIYCELQTALLLSPADDGSYTAEQVAQLTQLYIELRDTHPDSAACRRIPLDFTAGADFAAVADEYIRTYVTKGIPSLFSDLRPLYKCAFWSRFSCIVSCIVLTAHCHSRRIPVRAAFVFLEI